MDARGNSPVLYKAFAEVVFMGNAMFHMPKTTFFRCGLFAMGGYSID